MTPFRGEAAGPEEALAPIEYGARSYGWEFSDLRSRARVRSLVPLIRYNLDSGCARKPNCGINERLGGKVWNRRP